MPDVRVRAAEGAVMNNVFYRCRQHPALIYGAPGLCSVCNTRLWSIVGRSQNAPDFTGSTPIPVESFLALAREVDGAKAALRERFGP